MRRIIIPEGQMLQQKDADAMYTSLMTLPEEGRLVEIGTGYGHSANFFSEAKPNWGIYTIDSFGLSGDRRVYEEFNPEEIDKLFHDFKGTNIIQILGDSNKIHWRLPVDVIYIDGGHYYDCVKADFENYSPYLKDNGYIFFHDYHREDFGVRKFVDELIATGEWVLMFAWKVAIVKRK